MKIIQKIKFAKESFGPGGSSARTVNAVKFAYKFV